MTFYCKKKIIDKNGTGKDKNNLCINDTESG